jgi:TolA-binding protein
MITGDKQCPDDLLVRGRRQQVSELERRVLDAHLGQCASCRAALVLGALFDTVPETLPGDSELLGRVSSRATRKRPFIRRWTRAVAAAAAVVLFAGVAAAAWVTVGHRVLESRPVEKVAASSPARGRLLHRAPVSSRAIPALAPSVEESPTAPASPEVAALAVATAVGQEFRREVEVPRVQGPTREHRRSYLTEEPRSGLGWGGERRIEPLPVDPLPETATRTETLEPAAPRSPSQFPALPQPRREDSRYAPPDVRSLFAEANAVRRAGELGRAVGLYQRLGRDFPGSAQALLASVSEGDLLLRLGDPAGALAAFDSYLDHASGGSLAEEALFGRARCLARLGRTAEERQTWEALVHRFPRSAYQPAALKRLGELGH